MAIQHNKFVAAASAAKLRTRQEEELRSMVAEQERKAGEFEKLFDLVSKRQRKVTLPGQTSASAHEAVTLDATPHT